MSSDSLIKESSRHSKPWVPLAGGTPLSAGGLTFRGDGALSTAPQALSFLPSRSEKLLQTSAQDIRSTAPTASGTAFVKASVLPINGLPVASGLDLVERSAFVYGLHHTDRLVHDVHDAIAAVAAAAASTVGDDTDNGSDGQRNFHDSVGEGATLVGVFYFSSRPPWRDMPWRPTYKSAVLLCVFVSAAACQRAIARLNGMAGSIHCGAETCVWQLSHNSSPLTSTGVAPPRITLRPASEYELGPESVDTALLTFLTAPKLADLLLRRRRVQAPLELSTADGVVGRGSLDRAEDMLAYIRGNPPSCRLSCSAARLFAAILSPHSMYSVDWAAAQIAVRRGDGVVVPEMEVVEPWVGGYGFEDRSDALREQDRRGRGDTADSARAGSGHSSDVVRHLDGRLSWKSHGNSLPLTLQEEAYRRRYGVTPHFRFGGGGGAGEQGDNGEGFTGLMPVRSSLYRGARQLFRGASWVLRRLRDGLGEEEAPLMSGSGSTPALHNPPPLTTNALHPPSSQSGAPALHRERGSDEPPRQRHRTEETDSSRASERLREEAIVIPRYNAIGTALSWVPGFHHFGQLFVTSTTVLSPQGAAPRAEAGKRSQRRRGREEEIAADAHNNPAWEPLVMRRYADASAAMVQASHHSSTMVPAHDSVLSWMSPARGTGWPAASWPSQEMLQTPQVGSGSAEKRLASLPWGINPKGERLSSARSAAEPGTSKMQSLTASTIAPNALTSVQLAGDASQFRQCTPTLRSPVGGADVAMSESIYNDSAVRRSSIKVESVRSTLGSADPSYDTSEYNGSSFLRHHRRRQHPRPTTEPDIAAGEVPGVSVPDASSRTSRTRSSFADGLRKFTSESRADVRETSAPHTPVGPDQTVAGVGHTHSGALSSKSELPKRSSRRTVSFTV